MNPQLKVYGIDYTLYATGRGNVKLAPVGNCTLLFVSEQEFLARYVELKERYDVGNIKVFESLVQKQQYIIETI